MLDTIGKTSGGTPRVIPTEAGPRPILGGASSTGAKHMPLGPVFHAELITTARRARYFIIRALYGLLLLIVIWSGYQAILDLVASRGGEELTIREMAVFAQRLFQTFTLAQFLTIVVLTPALVAPVIAAEKSRKTLHYLLSSRLTGVEIVLGKLAARLLLLVVLVAVGLPVLCLLSLFGGIDEELTIRTYAALGALTVFLGGLSILVSTLATEPRRAIFHAYAMLAFLAIAPTMIYFLMVPLGPIRHALINGLWTIWPMPMAGVIGSLLGYGPMDSGDLSRLTLVWTLYGMLMLGLAIVLIRPLGRREGNCRRVELRIDNRGRWRWRVLPRPVCGDGAMLWKERYTSRSGGVVKLVGLFVNLFLTVLIGCFAFELAKDAWRDLSHHGYGDWYLQDARWYLNSFLRVVSFGLVALWMLGITGSAAGSITSEREGDTWISLLGTPLTGGEIVRAKMLGAILRFKWLGILLGVLWLLGLALGAIHPLGLVLAILELPIFLGTAAALGVACSLTSTTTARALALALGVLAFTNGGYLIVQWISPAQRVERTLGGVAPWVLCASLASYSDVTDMLHGPEAAGYIRYGAQFAYGYGSSYEPPRSQYVEALPAIAYGTVLYLVAGLVLVWQTIRRFDQVEDRPRTTNDSTAALPVKEQRRRWAL